MKIRQKKITVLLLNWVLLIISAEVVGAGETEEFTDGKNAASVLGQADFVSSAANRGGAVAANTANVPWDVAVDPATGKVFVSDTANHRVLRFASADALVNGSAAEAVLGQGTDTSATPDVTRSRMDGPLGIVISPGGRLWVADSTNNRVLRFDNASTKLTGANADGVLGQPNFVTKTAATTQNGMMVPADVAVESNGRLWVMDHLNGRVLRFDNAAGKADGGNADGVLGQPDFTTSGFDTDQDSLSFPTGVAVDGAGILWVADNLNNRVLRFDSAAAKSDGGSADGVLGQTSFTASGFPDPPTQTSMNGPTRLAVDSAGQLWVADTGNRRVLRFENAAAKGDGVGADGVLGQPGFETADQATSRNGMKGPTGVAVEGRKRLWVADGDNHRMLRFDSDSYQPDGWIGTKRARQKGNNRYSTNGAGQVIKVKVRGSRTAKAFFTIENDGDVTDNIVVKAAPGNRKIDVTYIQIGGGNVTGALTNSRGLSFTGLGPGVRLPFKVRISGTLGSRGKRATLGLKMNAVSKIDGERDVLKAKVKKTR